jgi:DNA-directed RNA polymerase I subunit RPA2
LLAPLSTKKTSSNAIRQKKCQCCGKRGQVVTVNLPYVFRYLTAELSAMNIRLSLEVAPVTG